MQTREKDFLSSGVSSRKSRIENMSSSERKSNRLVEVSSDFCFLFSVIVVVSDVFLGVFVWGFIGGEEEEEFRWLSFEKWEK